MWRDEHLLLDMLIYAPPARDFNAGMDWQRFSGDLMLQHATQYALRCVGEAASKVSKEYRAANAHVRLEKIASFRHRLVHDYPRIELPKVWAVVQNLIGPLIDALEPLVPPPPNSGAPPARE